MTRRPKRGYVLLMTLMLLTVCGMMLTAIASHSMSLSLESHLASKDLQRRWVMASLQRFAMDHRHEILTKSVTDTESDQKIDIVLPSSAVTIGIEGTLYSVRLDDEQAKLNINTVIAHRDSEIATKLVRKLSPKVDSLTVRLRVAEVGTENSGASRLESWGQVFEIAPKMKDATGVPQAIDRATRRVTLWGPYGKLHFRAAEQEVLQEVCRLAIDPKETSELIKLRSENPDKNLEAILNMTDLSYDKRTRLLKLLTSSPQAHSVWIHARQQDEYAHSQIVREEVGQSSHRIYCMYW